jgi:protein nagD homolog
MECAMELFNYKKEDIVMVGDNYDTDIMSGINSGIDTIHVQTGVTTLENLKLKKIQPTYTIEDLSKLIED